MYEPIAKGLFSYPPIVPIPLWRHESMLRGMLVPMLPAAVDSHARWRVLTRNTDTLDTDGHWKTNIASPSSPPPPP